MGRVDTVKRLPAPGTASRWPGSLASFVSRQAVGGVLVAYLLFVVYLATGDSKFVLLAPVLAAVPLAFGVPRAWPVFVIAAGLALPWIYGVGIGPITLSISDVMLLGSLPGILLCGEMRQRHDKRGRVGVVPALFALYAAVALFVYLQFPVSTSLLTIATRSVMVLVPFACGVALANSERVLRAFLHAYVASCAALAAVWLTSFGSPAVAGINKNPGGQMLAGAILVGVVIVKKPALRTGLVLLLGGGLAATGSRGAVVGLMAGCLVLFVLHSETRRRMSRLGQFLVSGLIAFALGYFGRTQSAFLDRSLSNETLDQRALLRADALERWHANPIGNGVGTYVPQVAQLSQLRSNDPHNVFVLCLYEGGIPLLVAFVLLCLVPVFLVIRRSRFSWIHALAVAVPVSLLVRSYFDIYWVRATPTLCWVILGAALATRVPSARKDQAV